MNKLRVGILGCANIAIKSLAPAFKNHPSFELIAFAGRDTIKTNETSKKFECEALNSYQLLIDRNDIDLVYIPLPNSLHYEWVMKSLRANKHVLCEKSLGCNYEEVESMVNESRRNNKLLIENFQFRFHSQHQFIKNMIKNGDIGQIRSFRSSFGFPPFLDTQNIRYNSKLGGGALLDAGAYTIKATQFIMGDGFVVKAANLKFSKEMNVDIFGGIYMQNELGEFAELSFGFDNFYQCNYEIWGSKGKVIATRAFTASPGFEPIVIIEKQDSIESKKLPADDHFSNLLTHIIKCIEMDDFETENLQNLQQANNIRLAVNLARKYFY
jgi:NDP-hexose-3-ketoreductase